MEDDICKKIFYVKLLEPNLFGFFKNFLYLSNKGRDYDVIFTVMFLMEYSSY